MRRFPEGFLWGLPQALEDEGGWRTRDTAARFAAYAGACFGAFGDRVRWRLTIERAGGAVITLDALARPSGTFLMVAMDQRESLRTMLEERHGAPIRDERLAAFTVAVTRELSPYASALLVDREYGWFGEIVRRRLVAPGCGLILAVDALRQEPGQVVEDTDLDTEADVAAATGSGGS
jgi:tagatose-1,6-bisphosphate aldolase